jgi:hypothetical protein
LRRPIYLTFNDHPSGIYTSQVTDVIRFLKEDLKVEIRLLAMISLRGFASGRRRIKQECPDAIVLPMFPGVARWRTNRYALKVMFAIMKPGMIIGRSVLATQLALFNRGTAKVVYDGRGAIKAEWSEYDVVKDKRLISEIGDLEKEVVLKSDFRIAVSMNLVNYWRSEYSYSENNHVVIPCTLAASFEKVVLAQGDISGARQKLGLKADDIVFVYSGSVSGWQGFSMIADFMRPVLKGAANNKLVFLSDRDLNIDRLMQEFPAQVVVRRLHPAEVSSFMIAGDYGLLIREPSVTNKVASPVKFAEYLACGLRVIISPDLGDYSDFVRRHDCGWVIGDKIGIIGQDMSSRSKVRSVALQYFTKTAHRQDYEKVLGIM